MATKHGDRILLVLKKIEASGIQIQKGRHGSEDKYTFGDDRYEILIEIDPEHYLGATFTLRECGIYMVNTDLYPLDADLQFTQGIEDDIVAMLDSLRNDKLLIAHDDGKHGTARLVIPLHSHVALIRKGWWIFGSSERLGTIQEVKNIENFEPFPFKSKK